MDRSERSAFSARQNRGRLRHPCKATSVKVPADIDGHRELTCQAEDIDILVAMESAGYPSGWSARAVCGGGVDAAVPATDAVVPSRAASGLTKPPRTSSITGLGGAVPNGWAVNRRRLPVSILRMVAAFQERFRRTGGSMTRLLRGCRQLMTAMAPLPPDMPPAMPQGRKS